MKSEAINILVEEHELILKKASLLKEYLETEQDLKEEVLNYYLDFFRMFADGLHHGKEELILFPEMKSRNESWGMLTDELGEHHELFKAQLSEIANEISNNNPKKIKSLFLRYLQDLEDHVMIENEELFFAADEYLDEHVLESIYHRMIDFNSSMQVPYFDEIPK